MFLMLRSLFTPPEKSFSAFFLARWAPLIRCGSRPFDGTPRLVMMKRAGPASSGSHHSRRGGRGRPRDAEFALAPAFGPITPSAISRTDRETMCGRRRRPSNSLVAVVFSQFALGRIGNERPDAGPRLERYPVRPRDTAGQGDCPTTRPARVAWRIRCFWQFHHKRPGLPLWVPAM